MATSDYYKGEPVDDDAVTELILFTENDAELWGPGNTQGESIRKNLARKHENGTLRIMLVPKLFQYLMDAAAKKYAKDYGGVWNEMFPIGVRTVAAQRMGLNYVESEYPTGYGLKNKYGHGYER